MASIDKKEDKYLLTLDKEELLEIIKALEDKQGRLLSKIFNNTLEDYLQQNKELYHKLEALTSDLLKILKTVDILGGIEPCYDF